MAEVGCSNLPEPTSIICFIKIILRFNFYIDSNLFLRIAILNIIVKIDNEIIGTSSIIALFPHGRGITKKANEQNEIILRIIINSPNFFIDDFLITLPIISEDNAIKKKKMIDTMV